MADKKREMQWTFPSFCAILLGRLASSGREAGHRFLQSRAGADPQQESVPGVKFQRPMVFFFQRVVQASLQQGQRRLIAGGVLGLDVGPDVVGV